MTEYQKILDAISNYYESGSDQWTEIAKYGFKADNAESILSQVPNVDLFKNSNGDIIGWGYNEYSSASTGKTLAEILNSNTQTGTVSPSNSATITIPAEMGIDPVTQNVTISSGLRSAGKYVFTNVIPAICAVSTGISVGKAIDKTLYNANPEFWISHNMQTLDPDTWSSITNGSTSLGANAINMLLKINPDKTTSAYINSTAYAYMVAYMNEKGSFSDGNGETGKTPGVETLSEYSPFAYGVATPGASYPGNTENRTWVITQSTSPIYAVCSTPSDEYYMNMLYSKEPFTYESKDYGITYITRNANYSTYYNLYYASTQGNSNYSIKPFPSIPSESSAGAPDLKVGYDILYTGKITEAIQGITTQPGAVVPVLGSARTVPEVLQKLREQYPTLFDNAIINSVVQNDGTIKNYEYIQVGVPESLDINDSQPVSGNSTQQNMNVSEDTATGDLLKFIEELLAKIPNISDVPTTGSGNTPAYIPPVGSASALYSIYNPTNSELNSFGGWLWSSSFVDQLLKLFNDPMQAIIGLHKVFATPSISGRGDIKVGYLDSGVETNLVNNQYVTIDCGTISLDEYFGNVFDYDPYTKINIYLPFVGIESLNVSDVMRSTINVIYKIDVITGACLAELNITRDNAGGVLYTYTGNCAVQYPISSGSYMGIVSSLATVAGGVVGTIASGGSLAPLALGAVNSALNAHTSIKHSGSFSGNSGAMGIKKPYLIIERPQSNLADKFPEIIGYPSNYYTPLSNATGFVSALDFHLEDIPATDSELMEIESLLKNGIIL